MATKYQSKYKEQMDQVSDQLMNREPFVFNVNEDGLYDQLKDQYVSQGKMAMMDTMGQAADLTGGYGSSYAQQAGQQAYQGYLQGLNDVVPELYQMALDKYTREGDALKDQYALLAEQDERDYARYLDALDRQLQEQQLAQQAAKQAVQEEDASNPEVTAVEKVKSESDAVLKKYGPSVSNTKVGSLLNQAVANNVATNRGGTAAYNGSLFADFDAGDWEGYFAAIRQSEGVAAAEAELKELNSKGLIPTNMVNYAAIGARGGQKGH